MRRLIVFFIALAFTLVFVLGAWTKPARARPAARADTVADFYKKNTVTVVVPYGAGGGTDYGARVVAAWWADVTNGGSMIVKNRPGGGGHVGLEEVFRAKPDGLTIGSHAFSTNIIAPYFARDPAAARYDIGKFNWLGLYGLNEYGFTVSAATPYKSMADLQKAKGLKFASVGRGNDWSQIEAMIIEWFGLDAVIVPGFASTAETWVALGRGEVHGKAAEMQVLWAGIDRRHLKPPLLTLGYKRSEWAPDAPTLPELIRLTPEQQQMFDLVVNSYQAGKVFYAPPGVDPEKVEFLRRAFDALQKNRSFIAMAKLRFKIMNPPLTGEQVGAKVKELLATPPEIAAGLRALLDKYVR